MTTTPGKSFYFKKQSQELPWLMLPDHSNDDINEDFRSCFNISSNDALSIELPGAQGKRICGSSKGWLIIHHTLEIFMLNPLTRIRIQLPPVPSLLHEDGASNVVHKAIVVSKPDHNLEGYIIVAIYGDSRKLAVLRAGDETWTPLDQDAMSLYEDILIFDDVLYAVNECGKIVTIDEPTGSMMVEEMVQPWFFEGNKVYLVEIDEELFIVIRFMEKSLEFGYRTCKFKIYEVDFHFKRHDRIKGLGEWAIFLGHNQSIALSTLRVEGLKRNCIYFTDDFTYGYKEGVLGGHDMGVFNLEEESIEPLPCCSGDSKFIWPPPIWFTPEF